MIENINKNVNKVIITISFFICVFLLLEELYNLSKFAFNYNYNYNVGNTLNKISGNDYIEYETNRFQIYNNINNIRLKNDIFTKSRYVNYIYLISVFYLLIVIISFGLLFYENFIGNSKCQSLKDKESIHNSFLYAIFNCMCGDYCTETLNDCFISYLLVAFIAFVIPFYMIFKGYLNIDFSYYNYFKYVYLIIFVFILIYRFDIKFLDLIRSVNEKYSNNYTSFYIYIFGFIVFLCALYIFYDLGNINNSNNSIIDINENEDLFYELYSNVKPTKPKEIPKPVILDTFIYFNQNAINNMTDTDRNNYINNKKIIDKYYSDVKQYDIDLNNYNIAIEMFNLSTIDDPPKIDIFNDVIKNMFGINNYNIGANDISKYVLILFVISIIIYLFYYFIKDYSPEYKPQERLIYSCFFIPFFNLFLIVLLVNSISVLNTYINKYIIYNPMAAYKSDMSNINWYFCKLYEIYNNINNNNIVNPKIGNSILYNIYSGLFSVNLLNNKLIKPPIQSINIDYNIGDLKSYNKPLQNGYVLLANDDSGIITNNENLINFIKNIFYTTDNDIYNISINLTNNIINDINNYNTSLFVNSTNLRNILSHPGAVNIVEIFNDKGIDKNKYSIYINNIVKIYTNYIKHFNDIFIDALLKGGADCSNLKDIFKMTSNIDLYQKIVHPSNKNSNDFYFLNNEIMNNINELFYKFIDEIYYSINNDVLSTSNSISSTVISNYNDYNDTYIFDGFISENINVNDSTYLANEDNMKNNIQTTQIGSYVLFFIIIIIILEPIYIET